MIGAQHARVLDAFDIVPPDLALPVDDTAARDGHVVGVEHIQKGLHCVLTHLSGGLVVAAVG